MAKEPSDSEIWDEWRNSDDSTKRALADLYFPRPAIEQERREILETGNGQRAAHFRRVLDKYENPNNGTLPSDEIAHRALVEIRHYHLQP